MGVGFPGVTVVRNPPANARYSRSIPGSGRSPGEGNGNPFQYFCLEILYRGARLSPWGHKRVGQELVTRQQQRVTCCIFWLISLIPGVTLILNLKIEFVNLIICFPFLEKISIPLEKLELFLYQFCQSHWEQR